MKLAIIPARGGSKRIPRKNIREFCGKPIIAYSIEAALASGLFDEVAVSTDDGEIASIARAFGATTRFERPANLSDDYTGTSAVVKHALQWFDQQGESVSLVCCIYATAPFLCPKYLKEGYDLLVASDKSFAFSVTSFPFPIQRAVFTDINGDLKAFSPAHIANRSQDLREFYHDAGQFYWGRPKAFLDDRVLFSSNSIPVILPRYLVHDLDTEEDWSRATLVFTALEKTMGNGKEK